MILHRPGCDHLDTFVRDLSFIIHSYDIKVTSPLLEMSNIDAQGGLASYITRNIDTCTYVLVLITEHTPGSLMYRYIILLILASKRKGGDCTIQEGEVKSNYLVVFSQIIIFFYSPTHVFSQLEHNVRTTSF